MVQTIASDAVLQNFYDSAQNSNMGMLDSAVASIGDSTNITSQILSTITPDNNAEANARIVYAIYNTLTDTGLYLMDSVQYQTLYSIAIQNPISGGPGVYNARAMLNWEQDDAGGALRLQNIEANLREDAHVKFYPNPTATKVFLPYFINENETIRVELFNVMGIKLISQGYSEGQDIVIDLTNQSNSIYMVKVLLNNRIWFYDKIIVAK